MDVERLSAIPGKDGEYRQAVEHIKTLAENSVNEVRNMSLLLRPSMLDDLDWLRRSNGRRAKYPSARNAGGFCGRKCFGQLARGTQDVRVRIVQEALNNCSKARICKACAVTIRQKPEHSR